MADFKHLTQDEANELEVALEEVYRCEADPNLPVGSHATLMMVIRKLFNYNASKQEAKQIAERELAGYYNGYRE